MHFREMLSAVLNWLRAVSIVGSIAFVFSKCRKSLGRLSDFNLSPHHLIFDVECSEAMKTLQRHSPVHCIV
jgi:hypothetical protein